MSKMGKYCKAYQLKNFRDFPQWSEQAENAKKEKVVVDDQEVERIRKLEDDSILYLQENYVVTDDIFKDENIIFNNVTPEWVSFCQNDLKFKIPHMPKKNLKKKKQNKTAGTRRK